MIFSNPIHKSICVKCGAEFDCGDSPAQKCWCNFVDILPDPNFAGKCLCPKCLKVELSHRLEGEFGPA